MRYNLSLLLFFGDFVETNAREDCFVFVFFLLFWDGAIVYGTSRENNTDVKNENVEVVVDETELYPQDGQRVPLL